MSVKNYIRKQWDKTSEHNKSVIARVVAFSAVVTGLLAYANFEKFSGQWRENWKDGVELLRRTADNVTVAKTKKMPASRTYQLLAADTMDNQFHAQLLDNDGDTVYFSAPVVGASKDLSPGSALAKNEKTEKRLVYDFGDNVNVNSDDSTFEYDAEKIELQDKSYNRLNEDYAFDHRPLKLFNINRDMMTERNQQKFAALVTGMNNSGKLAIFIGDGKISDHKPKGFTP